MRHTRGSRIFALLFLAVAVTGLIAASVTTAATVYRPTGGSFATPGSGEGELGSFAQLGVDGETGDPLIPYRFQPTVNVYEPSGDSASYLMSFGETDLTGAYGLAVDQSARTVYVGDPGGSRIVKFTISGTNPPAFTVDSSFASPPQGSGAGEIGNFYSPLAVDPASGDLLVADAGNQRVSRFTPSGAFISSFDGSDAPAGAFHQLSSIAVGNGGEIYVVDVTKGDLLFEGAESVVERFAPDGTADPAFAPAVETPRTVAVDPSSNNLIVLGRSDGGYEHLNGEGPYPIRLYVFQGDQAIDQEDFPAGSAGGIATGVTVDGGATGRMYVATEASFLGGRSQVTVFDSFTAPNVALDAPGEVTTSTAHLTGTVDPLGKAARYRFEYSREGGDPQSTEEVELGPVSGPQPVETELTGLTANSSYSVRLVATYPDTGVVIKSTPRHLQTLESAPGVSTGPSVDVTTAGATLNGTVNPFGKQTAYHFEYGPTSAYGARTPADHDDVAGAGRDPLPVHAYLTGLQPGTEYHYRLVAENAGGTAAGADRTFTTKSAGVPPRSFEQVSPVEKGGSDVNGLRGFYSSPDGERLMFQWKAAPSEAEAAPVSPRSWATRETGGWISKSLDAPQTAGVQTFANPILTFVLGISEDSRKSVTISLDDLAPGAVEGQSNLYLRDNRTGAFTTMTTQPGVSLLQSGVGLGLHPIVDGTPDYGHILIRPVFDVLLPGAPEGALYDWTPEGGLELVSIAPDGTPLGYVNAGGTTGLNLRDPHYISADGSKIFFEAGSGTQVRVDGEETVFIGGRFGGASRDGRYAFVYGQELTPDSEPGAPSLYRFDTASRELELLTPTGRADLEGHLQVSANGSSVFFVSQGALTPDAVPGVPNLYVWHGGQVRLMATTPRDGQNVLEYMASPNGRWFAFSSYSQLSEYDNSSKTACVNFPSGDPQGSDGKGVACREIYRYDVEGEQLLCASCPRDAAHPNGDARIGAENVEGDFSFARSMLDDGTVIFDTTEPLAARDSNSNRDVYVFDGSDTQLISGGRTASRSEFDEASADGRDIFFTTQDRLVGQDTDTVADVYDARVGGGIAAQNPPPPREECIRDDCKATPNAGPELPFGGSEGLSGPANVKPKHHRRCGKGRRLIKVRGKSRCVKRHPRHDKQTKSNRRQGR